MSNSIYDDICRDLIASIPEIELMIIFDINGNCIASALPTGIDEHTFSISAALALITIQKTMIAYEQADFEQLFINSENGYLIMMGAGKNRVIAARANRDIKLGNIFLDIKITCDKIAKIPYEMPKSKIDLKQKINELELQTSDNYRIFISYAAADFERFQIEKISQILEKKHPNVKTRYYKRDIQPGQDLIDYMEAGVLWGNIFLWFHSENSVQSSAVDKEYKMAEYEKKKVITITEDFNKLRPAVRVTWVIGYTNDIDKLCESIYNGLKST